MNQLNMVVVEANACRDVEIKTIGSGTVIGKMSIAVNRYYKSGTGFEKEVSFFDVECFGDTAKLCGEKVKKGDAIRVTGRLKQSRWEKDGKPCSAVVIIAERVEFASKAKGNQGDVPDDEDIPF